MSIKQKLISYLLNIIFYNYTAHISITSIVISKAAGYVIRVEDTGFISIEYNIASMQLYNNGVITQNFALNSIS
jgi:hypothetical protein